MSRSSGRNVETTDRSPRRCPLCAGPDLSPVRTPWPRAYRFCPTCLLVSVDPLDHPSVAAERRRYRLHRNDPDDEGYVRFLLQLVVPMSGRLAPGSRGLDYGCGPSPVLARLMGERGLRCEIHDPIFHDRRAVPPAGGRPLDPPYDFIACSEVFEHFRHPFEEIGHVVALLAPGAFLGVMTERWRTLDHFGEWSYLSDPTHLAFYHDRTMAWIASRFDLEAVPCDSPRVALFEMRAGSTV